MQRPFASAVILFFLKKEPKNRFSGWGVPRLRARQGAPPLDPAAFLEKAGENFDSTGRVGGGE